MNALPCFYSSLSARLRIALAAAILPAVAVAISCSQLLAQAPSDNSWKQTSGLDKAIVFAGTSILNNGQGWSYLLWQPGSDSLLEGRTLALYRKLGGADSNANYALESVINFSWDVRMAASVLKRAEFVGDDLAQLESALHANFRDVLPPSNASLAEKALFCIQSALQKPEMLGHLGLLARKHPGLAMLMGRAYVGQPPSGGSVTYELRDYDAVKKIDKAVIGRVTVSAAQPTVLPKTDPPYEVKPMPGSEPTAHLAVRLRWFVPTALRQLAILQFGYNVYRLPKSYVDAHNFAWQNPTLAALKTAVAAQVPARALNLLPVLPEDDLDAGAVTDGNDRSTVFFIDDNDALKPGGTPLHNGDEFYYFVCARDLLGRDGEPSIGTLVQICDYMPPLPPGRVKVEPEYDYNGNEQAPGGSQHFRLSWFDAGVSIGQTGPTGKEAATGFYIYRWSGIGAISSHGGKMDRLTGAVPGGIPASEAFFVGSVDRENNAWIFRPAGGVPVPGNVTVTDLKGLDRLSIVDKLGPTTPDNNGQSYTYTVRAYDDGACGRNVSGDSAPTLANPLDLITSTATAVTTLRTHSLVGTLTKAGQSSLDLVPDSQLWARFIVSTGNLRKAEWAEIEWPAGTLLGRVDFLSGVVSGTEEAKLDRVLAAAPVGKPRCRVRMRNGAETDWVEHDPLAPDAPPTGGGGTTGTTPNYHRKAAQWTFAVQSQEHVWVPGDVGQPVCDPEPESHGASGDLDPPADALRWRVYRSANFGPKVQIASGEGDAPFVWIDKQPPAHGGFACYYSQVDMGFGKVGPMTMIGDCVWMNAKPDSIPTPTLTKLERAAMSNGSAAMRVRWECAPYGFDRFEVLIIKAGSLPPATAGTDLSSELSGPFDASALADSNNFPPMGVYQTIRAAAMTGYPRNDFSALVPVDAGQTYVVMVRCVGPGTFQASGPQHRARAQGRPSEAKIFVWDDNSAVANQPAPAAGSLPWPARGLPRVLPAVEGFSMHLLKTNANALDKRFGPMLYLGTVDSVAEQAAGAAIATSGTGAVYSVIPARLDPHDWLGKIFDRIEVKKTLVSNGPPSEYKTEVTGSYRSLLPCVLYRRQINSDRFPVPNGQHRDWVQVTPMIEQIAYELQGNQTVIHDPWIVFTGMNQTGRDLWLVDRHPVVLGMAYEYALVLFDERSKEMHSILPVGTVTVE